MTSGWKDWLGRSCSQLSRRATLVDGNGNRYENLAVRSVTEPPPTCCGVGTPKAEVGRLARSSVARRPATMVSAPTAGMLDHRKESFQPFEDRRNSRPDCAIPSRARASAVRT